MMLKRNLIVAFAILLVATFSGCYPTANVKGTVTAGGKPVEGGDIIFSPQDKGVKPAAGQIEKDGTFVLKTSGNNGLTPGKYKVLFTAPLPNEEGGKLGPPSKWQSWRAPDVQITIDPGDNELAIELVQ